MRIKTSYLKGYNPFTFTGINSLELSLNSKVQILIGDNGSGKSSLMRELNPIPAVRTNYQKNGSKQIIVDHDGSEYILTSDFTNSKGAHSFIKDGTELNQSGTTTVQQELVEKHLGFTSAIAGLTTMRYRMCSMTRAERRQLLLSINPVDLTFILDRHKRVCSKIREFKNNLTLLHTRESELKSKILSEDVRKQMDQQKQVLVDQSLTLDNYIFIFERHISQLQKMIAEKFSGRLVDIHQIHQECRALNPKLDYYSHIPRDTASTQVHFLQTNLYTLESNTHKIKEELENIAKEISTYENYLQNSQLDEMMRLAEEQLLDVKKTITDLEARISAAELVLSRNEFEQIESIKNQLNQILLQFVGKEVKNLWPINKHQRVKRHVTYLTSKLSDFTSRITQLNSLVESIRNGLEMHTRQDAAPNPDCVLICPMKSNFEQRLLELQKQISGYEQERDKLIRTHTLKTKGAEHLNQQACSRNRFVELQEQLKEIFNQAPWLMRLVPNQNLIKMLDTDPTLLIRKVLQTEEITKLSFELEELRKRKLELETQIKSSSETKLPSVEFMETMLKDRRVRYDKLMAELLGDEVNIEMQQQELRKTEEFLELQQRVIGYKKDVDLTMEATTSKSSLKYYEQLTAACKGAKVKIGEQLRALEQTLREQDGYLARYENEVLTLITEIEAEKAKYETLEKCLAPSSGIPHKFMVRYLNALINNVNHFIESLCSYELKVVPVDEEQPIDFGLKCKVKEFVINDISECSTGQQNILDLAWTLAMLIHMQVADKYPLYLDEVDHGMDMTHRQKFLELINEIIDCGYIQQLFLINHHAPLFSGLVDSETLCLSANNILTPSVYNQHVKIN